MSEQGVRIIADGRGDASVADSEKEWGASVRRSRQRWLKRSLDVVITLVLLVLMLPTLLIIAGLVRLSSPGPVLFRQRRIGRDGEAFTLLKFRTMYENSNSAVHESYVRSLIAGTAEAVGDTFKLQRDVRVTRVGRVLRRLSLDELPQLLNVLAGNMSLVGPRPPLPYEVAVYSRRARRRLEVTPGLTGLWQVSGRSNLDFQQMIDLDLAYIERWSMWMDLQILARTPLIVFTGRGAC